MAFDLTGLNNAFTIAGQGAAAYRKEDRARQMAAIKERAALGREQFKYNRGRADKAADKADDRAYKANLKLAKDADKAKADADKATAKREESILKLATSLLSKSDVGGDPALAEQFKTQLPDQGDTIVDLAAKAGSISKQSAQTKATAKESDKVAKLEKKAHDRRNTLIRKINTRKGWYNAFMNKADSEHAAEGMIAITDAEYAEAKKWKREIEELQAELQSLGAAPVTGGGKKKAIPGF